MEAVQRISLNLPVTQANRFKTLKEDEKKILAMFVSSWLNSEEIDLKAIMDFIGYRAQQRGLTPEILEQILNEENP
jgi:hypothetical protein